MPQEAKESEKFKKFVKELKQLCIKHKVQFSVSGYDSMEVYDLPKDIDPIWINGIFDHTEGETK